MKHPLIILHGALGSKDQFTELSKILSEKFEIHSPNLEGHGGEISSNDFTTKLFAENLKDYILKNNLKGCHVFGYSMGGYIALELAKKNPGLIGRIITLGTKFKWDVESAEAEAKMMDPEVIRKKIPHFAESLEKRHAPGDWKEIMKKTAELMLGMPGGRAMSFDDFKTILNDVMILIGDKDKMVSKEESEIVSRKLPNGKFHLLENTPHPIEMVDLKILSELIINFLK